MKIEVAKVGILGNLKTVSFPQAPQGMKILHQECFYYCKNYALSIIVNGIVQEGDGFHLLFTLSDLMPESSTAIIPKGIHFYVSVNGEIRGIYCDEDNSKFLKVYVSDYVSSEITVTAYHKDYLQQYFFSKKYQIQDLFK